MPAAALAVVLLLAVARVELADRGGELALGEPSAAAGSGLVTAGENAPDGQTTEPARIGGTTRPPIAIGASWMCPTGHRVPAYANPPLAYPAGHPETPGIDVQPVTCARTLDDAAAVGFPQAPVPEGAELTGGVYLFETTEGVRVACAEAADQLGHAVACPARLPGEPPKEPCGSRVTHLQGCVVGLPAGSRGEGTPSVDGFLLEVRGFPSTTGAACPSCNTGVVVATELATNPTSLTGCYIQQEGGQYHPWVQPTPETGGFCDRARLDRFGVAPHAEHYLLRWQIDDVIVAVSARLGDPDAAEALARDMANRIEILSP